jgi:hypothetical protein
MLQNKVDYCAALLPSGSEDDEDFAHSVICSYVEDGIWIELVVSDPLGITGYECFFSRYKYLLDHSLHLNNSC